MEIAKINSDELSLVEDNALNASQLKLLLRKTPKNYVKTRPAKGGGTWDYVSVGYVKKILNLMFGWDWDFEILNEQIIGAQVIVKGKLTCRINSKSIIKTQYGTKDIIYKRGDSKDPLNIGNDFKAAASDSLKKCASLIGIASDIYDKEDFKEVDVVESNKSESITEKKRISDFIDDCENIEHLNSIKYEAKKHGLLSSLEAKILLLKK